MSLVRGPVFQQLPAFQQGPRPCIGAGHGPRSAGASGAINILKDLGSPGTPLNCAIGTSGTIIFKAPWGDWRAGCRLTHQQHPAFQQGRDHCCWGLEAAAVASTCLGALIKVQGGPNFYRLPNLAGLGLELASQLIWKPCGSLIGWLRLRS